MKRVLKLAGCYAASAVTAAAGSGMGIAHAEQAPPQVALCQGCHQGALGFSGRSVSELTAAIKALAASDKPHPPLPLGDGDEASARRLAQALLEAARSD